MLVIGSLNEINKKHQTRNQKLKIAGWLYGWMVNSLSINDCAVMAFPPAPFQTDGPSPRPPSKRTGELISASNMILDIGY